MKRFVIIAIGILILFSCNNNTTKQPGVPISTSDSVKNKTTTFFPVSSFIKGQMITLDSLPVTPLQLTTIDGKTDSAWLQKDKLRPLLLPFITPVISENNLIKYFAETKFKDQTLNAVTFTYDPINTIPDSISLRHWDVYVNPETGNVIKVYIVKKSREGNQDLVQQLTWKTDQMAKITTILHATDGSMKLIKEVTFIWDFRDAQIN